MFRCKECGLEYKEKPDYCDCGNDTFDDSDFDVKQADEIFDDEIFISRSSKVDFVSLLRRKGISVFGFTFFISCLVLSFLVLVFCFNFKTEKISNNSAKSVENKRTHIPDIEKLWVDSPVQVIQSKSVEKKQLVEPAQGVNKSQSVSKTTSVKQVSTKKSTPNTITTKSTVGKKTNYSNVLSKPVNKTTPQTSSTSTPQTSSTSTPQASVSTKLTQQSTTQKKEQVNITPIPPKTSPAYSQELNNYKIALRNALFSKLSVVSIQGKGSCGVEFSIDSTGKLVNRAFTYQSDNKSVNDEVYKMLMRLPSFYAPPDDYKGEKIKMNFSFDNGSYVINYTN